MGNTSGRENRRSLSKNGTDTFSEASISTRISIPNEKRDDQIAEDQISILELFVSPNKDLCIVLLKEKTFTGDCIPIYYIHIYYYDSAANEWVIVLNHQITDEIHEIDKALYDPNNNYILMYNTKIKEITQHQKKFYLFKFEYLTRNNPKLGMNGYNMTKLIHPHINHFGKCRYVTFLKKATELLFIFEKGYFILLTADETTKQYDHINYFSSRSSYKYLSQQHQHKKKSTNLSENSYPQSSPVPPSPFTPSNNDNSLNINNNGNGGKKKKRGYRVVMASVHEKRNRITWIECEYSHYYLQILSLKCILSHKRKPSESKEYYTEEYGHHNYTNSQSNNTQPSSPSPKSRVLPATPVNIPDAAPSFANINPFHLNQSSTPIPNASATTANISGLPPTPTSTQSNPSTPITPSLSSLSKKHKNGHNNNHNHNPNGNPVIRITPISIDMQQYLIVSRLIFANQKDMDTIREVFAEEYDIESRKLYHAEQWHNTNADDYGATKYRGVVRKKSDSLTRHDGAKYILDNFFGINPSQIKLLFNRNGDKILFQSMGEMLHHSYGQRLSHGDQYAGHLNDFGGLHVIDVTTGNSIWSLGSSSKDIGYGWFNEFLMVLPSINSASGLASSKSIYDPNKKSRSLSMSAMHSISSRQTHKSSIAYQPRRKHSHLQLLGFLSETSIAEAIYHNCSNTQYLNQFSWDLCVLLALYCGGMREYRQLSLAKYETKQKMNGYKNKKNNGKHNGKNGSKSKSKYTVSNIKLISNDILSIWNVNDNYYNLQLLERRDWLIIAIKSYRDTMRFIDIIFYEAKQIGMYDEDIFIPYNNDNDGLICRNLLGDSDKFDSLYYSAD